MGASVGVDVGHCVSFNVTVGESVVVLDMLVGMKDVVLVFKSKGAEVSLRMVGASVAVMVKLNSRVGEMVPFTIFDGATLGVCARRKGAM